MENSMTSVAQKSQTTPKPQSHSELESGPQFQTKDKLVSSGQGSEPQINQKLNQRTPVQGQQQLHQLLNQGAHQVAQAKLVQSLGGRPSGKGVVQRVGNGLAEPKLMASYTEPLLKDLVESDSSVRFEMLLKSINLTLEKAGIPPMEGELSELKGFAEFDPDTWKMKIPKSMLETQDPKIVGELVGTVYHEARHAEQYFRVAQKYASDGNDLGLFKLNLPEEVRKAAVSSKGQLEEASSTMKENIGKWTESLKKPEEILEQGKLAEFGLAKQVEVFKSAVKALISTAGELLFTLGKSELGAIELKPIDGALTTYKQEQEELIKAQKSAQFWTLQYRHMPHEQDAHILGWTVEDTFRTGKLQETFDPKYENRVPTNDQIWEILSQINLAVDKLDKLVELIQKATGFKTEEDELDELLELTVEEEAQQMAKFKTNQTSGPLYENAYSEALKFYQNKRQEKELRKKMAQSLSKEEVLEQLELINKLLSQWGEIEERYLSALSALLFRRTNI